MLCIVLTYSKKPGTNSEGALAGVRTIVSIQKSNLVLHHSGIAEFVLIRQSKQATKNILSVSVHDPQCFASCNTRDK